jgi:hypothetical protein
MAQPRGRIESNGPSQQRASRRLTLSGVRGVGASGAEYCVSCSAGWFRPHPGVGDAVRGDADLHAFRVRVRRRHLHAAALRFATAA